ncbi:MAG: hypothetical protein A3H57_04120 [Candidatus Taylorbacteria bacterium RIFCSPLOWO2_02_FULL_43_11]|uniref:Uncharacterized protein n=1 Tax=Candidatus Taylorbacteria bacterium RIFCSPHIGHO2_02_FULL_43_32b TaxID=1802306 RepID=A0A1G2MJY9_9BACT|nr:MAG: hypothetical protein A2743_04205 [Candidatus Taylorbacteria bacterium RIFCSPHIGHO2_01_FULL_43_47]OHA23312.1 MAG: hypothetical protein A3C72_04625 [Candidatus Taylorbacteria bacterium RIFCSPHIGHO2_02_FULL_43_32b]OHA30180.1 MAG: hypothetical protein A3B08_03755 [Candidatus Taylorbacteria bacterium RIFCSPLOWO2_01_FULL_43_44]OHA36011.1 MAG: hypothetical protein A3H57_04120 [Candidatus Taylorbacteria bacterium RIFCSPLOWO2_02_FULL_43_11]
MEGKENEEQSVPEKSMPDVVNGEKDFKIFRHDSGVQSEEMEEARQALADGEDLEVDFKEGAGGKVPISMTKKEKEFAEPIVLAKASLWDRLKNKARRALSIGGAVSVGLGGLQGKVEAQDTTNAGAVPVYKVESQEKTNSVENIQMRGAGFEQKNWKAEPKPAEVSSEAVSPGGGWAAILLNQYHGATNNIENASDALEFVKEAPQVFLSEFSRSGEKTESDWKLIKECGEQLKNMLNEIVSSEKWQVDPKEASESLEQIGAIIRMADKVVSKGKFDFKVERREARVEEKSAPAKIDVKNMPGANLGQNSSASDKQPLVTYGPMRGDVRENNTGVRRQSRGVPANIRVVGPKSTRSSRTYSAGGTYSAGSARGRR